MNTNIKNFDFKTKYLMSLDESSCGSNFVDRTVETLIGIVPYVVYGFVELPKYGEERNKLIDKWVNPKLSGNSFESSTVKVGMIHTDSQTYSKMTVKEAVCTRCEQQFNCSSLLDEYMLVFCFPSNETDYKFRDFLWGDCVKQSREGYESECVGYLNKRNIKEFYNMRKSGIKRAENFQLSRMQRNLTDFLVNLYVKGINIAMVGAKPRSGKTYAILHVIKELNFKTSLFLSYLPTVFSSLESDVNNHVDFDGWQYVNLRKKQKIDTTKVSIISTSAQLLNYSDEDASDFEGGIIPPEFKKNLMNLSEYNIDCIVIDEAHFGGNTESINDIIKTLNPKFTIYVTGTCSKYTYDERFSEENTFIYDYFDECEDEDYHAKCMPKFKLFAYQMDNELKQLCKDVYKTEEFPTFHKLFEVGNDNKFKHPFLVEEFLRWAFGNRKFSSEMDIKGSIRQTSISPFNNPDFYDKINHCLVLLPTVKSVKAAIKLIKQKQIIDLNEFRIIDASGYDGVKEIKFVKNEINSAKSKHQKTLTFTCQRFREGVTVPEWSGLFLFDDGKSYDRIIQTMYRVQGHCPGKEYCYCFDFNIERTLEVRYNFIYRNGRRDYNVDEMIRKLNDCMPLVCYDKFGNIIDNNRVIDLVFKVGKSNGAGLNEFSDSSVNLMNIVKNKDFAISVFNNVLSKISSFPVRKIDIFSNGLEGGKTYSTVKKIVKSLENGKDYTGELRKLKIACIDVLKHLPEFLFIIKGKYSHIGAALKDEYAEIFEECTGISIDEFKTLIEYGIFDVERIDGIIRDFYDDKENLFDLSMMFTDDSNQHNDIIKNLDEFSKKWIYESDTRSIDTPYLTFLNFV